MFENLVFDDTRTDINERYEFEGNKRVKGEFLLKQIYDVLIDINESHAVSFQDIIYVVKYNKSLRDKLYVFLAIFEKALKADIFRRFDVSYEDTIEPVEKAYDRFRTRNVAVLGGMDVNYLVNANVEDISKRCNTMLELSRKRGGYAFGTGNSVPEYISNEKYFAMIDFFHINQFPKIM